MASLVAALLGVQLSIAGALLFTDTRSDGLNGLGFFMVVLGVVVGLAATFDARRSRRTDAKVAALG